MTALFTTLLSISIFFVPNFRGNPVNFKLNQEISKQVNFMPTFTDSTFTVQNQTSIEVGWVTISEANSTNNNVNVTGNGTFNTTLTDYPVECSIHGHSFGIGIPTRITIDAHTSIRATWNSSVLILDDGETM